MKNVNVQRRVSKYKILALSLRREAKSDLEGGKKCIKKEKYGNESGGRQEDHTREENPKMSE